MHLKLILSAPLFTQAALSTRPNLYKEAPSVGQRRPNCPPPLSAGHYHALSGTSTPKQALAGNSGP